MWKFSAYLALSLVFCGCSVSGQTISPADNALKNDEHGFLCGTKEERIVCVSSEQLKGIIALGGI